MAYSVAIPITLPESMIGKSLSIRFFSAAETNNTIFLAAAITTGFREIGSGWYTWLGTIPDAWLSTPTNGLIGFQVYETSVSAKILQVGTLNPAEVQYVDVAVSSRVSLSDTLAELGVGKPAATPTVAQALMLLYMALRDQMDTTATSIKFYNDAGTVIAQAALSDDGTTFTRGELASG